MAKIYWTLFFLAGFMAGGFALYVEGRAKSPIEETAQRFQAEVKTIEEIIAEQ